MAIFQRGTHNMGVKYRWSRCSASIYVHCNIHSYAEPWHVDDTSCWQQSYLLPKPATAKPYTVLRCFTQKWYGACRAVRTDGAAHGCM